ncbi:MAG: helix-turn-helix domain-containing protein [Flavobacteriales bacterium]|nr:helix-turn-helix domain-containing protein [Flavobacteriales bacterium]
MANSDYNNIPIHKLDTANVAIQVKSIGHENHYDYTTQHRHHYFEIMFFVGGGGKNLIDFVEYEVKSNACYIIYPNQIHLLNRAPGSHGVLIQFKRESIVSAKLQRLLQERAWSGKGAVLFENNAGIMKTMLNLVNALNPNSKEDSAYCMESRQHLLHAILFDLFSVVNQDAPVDLENDIYQFLQLIDAHFKEEQQVSFYLSRLSVSDKKLAQLSKKYTGISPLQVIHKRILLEAKRLLVAKEHSHKEIAYDLGFDSPASFSAFIKKKTGLTASEIQAQVTEIHNH